MIDYSICRSLAAMFFEVAAERGESPFLWAKQGGKYQSLSWAETARMVNRLARGLVALGIEPGDRVALAAENRPEWAIADLAIMSAGAITVPAYTTNTIDDNRHVFGNSGVRIVIASKPPISERAAAAAAQLPSVQVVIAMDEPMPAGARSWNEVLALGDAQPDDIAQRVAALAPDDIACIIYTSGTGGLPKGVLATHRNILANCRGAYHLLEMLGLGDEVFLSFLPLSHSYEHTAGLMFPISIGAQIYFAEGADSLAANLLEAKPTIMTAVPRLYETMHQRIRRGIEREKGLKRRMFEMAVTLGQKRLAGERHRIGERTMDRVLERLVRDKVRARFGGRLKAMVSGGAPLNPEIGSFFLALGVQLLQGYGQTEAAPVIACNPPGNIRIDSVGPALRGVEIKIAEDGEILVAGDNVMQGYWNDPEATARTITDGWLRTGDIGFLDAHGYLRITDRKRDFIKNSGGDMIAPAKVEGALTLQTEVAQAMVFGDQRPHLVAILVPDPEFASQFGAGGTELAALAEHSGLLKALGEVVSRVNATLPPVERIRRFVVAREAFTTANGQLTPTLKIKRHIVRAVYRDAIEALYESRSAAA
ncbi:MAG TPA: long-chain fatty acid--CoA ligase [Stellaceae bacterium]|nr:long-chain fatty acid--CoA ligase [Stellaceae bacterium]